MIDTEEQQMLYFRFLKYLESENYTIEQNMYVFDDYHIFLGTLGGLYDIWLDENT